MENSEKLKTQGVEKLEDDALDSAAGGNSHLKVLICSRCGHEVKPTGWQHNFVANCPKCGQRLNTW